MKRLILLFVLVFYYILSLSGQIPAAVANFQRPEHDIRFTPEHPSFCSKNIGVIVTMTGLPEQVTSINWRHLDEQKQLDGNPVNLNIRGNWEVRIRYLFRGVECEEVKRVFVADLSKDVDIQEYFIQSGFWPVPVFRDPQVGAACRNCDCNSMLEQVSFGLFDERIRLSENVEKFAEFRPFAGMDYVKQITNKSCLCNENGTSNISAFEQTLGSGELSLWGHQYFGSETATSGTLYLKASMSWQEESPVGTHRARLDVIRPAITGTSQGTAEKARILITNLFMNQPIGGYAYQNECDFANLIVSGDIILTPAAVPLQVSNSFQKLGFGLFDNENESFEGALISFELDSKKYQGYKYLVDKFSGYFNDIKGELIVDFNEYTDNIVCRGCVIKLPILCNGECTIYEINSDNDYPISNSGGIGLNIRNKNSIPGVTCFDIGCGKFAGDREIDDLINTGMVLTDEDKSSLRDFFSIMYCEDKEIFDCFREGQLNPGSNIDLFLEDIKAKLLLSPNALLAGCADLSPYVDRWYELATFNANSVPPVKSKLEQLGDEYWIQTLENATNLGNFWWKIAPSVNMDFFGIKITKFPNKPYPPFTQFTPNEFFSYIQQNFAESSAFMGYGNLSCEHEYGLNIGFQYNSTNDIETWLNGTRVPATFTIVMPDDGNVICSQYQYGSYWTFSTLNAPGWLEGGSQDGFHPVSGNRRFGLTQNQDGSYTFYTSGVDRLTGFWHAFADFTPLVNAFKEADQLWYCFLDKIKHFVTINHGLVYSKYDCTTVRPKWKELRNAIKAGCQNLNSKIHTFPCSESELCK